MAGATIQDLRRRPSSWIIIAGAALLIFFADSLTLFPFTDSDKLRMALEMALATFLLCLVLLVAIHASSLIAGDIERRTTLAILAKPVGRGQYFLGKFLGFAAVLAGQALLLAGVMLISVWYQTQGFDPPQEFYPVELLKAALLFYIQAILLAGAAVFISLFFRYTETALLTVALFLIGNQAAFLKGLFADSYTGIFLSFLARLLPDFCLLNLTPAIAAAKNVPFSYCATAVLYGILYISALLFAGIWTFERKEIA
jgi:ABC-type transport system involved in multi-copper enzyme maturation permease subunit